MKRQRLKPGLRVLAVVPDSSAPRLTRSERLALAVRNAATAAGHCACGARAEGVPADLVPGEVYLAEMRHEDDCPAVSAAARRAGRKLARRARAASIPTREDPWL